MTSYDLSLHIESDGQIDNFKECNTILSHLYYFSKSQRPPSVDTFIGH